MDVKTVVTYIFAGGIQLINVEMLLGRFLGFSRENATRKRNWHCMAAALLSVLFGAFTGNTWPVMPLLDFLVAYLWFGGVSIIFVVSYISAFLSAYELQVLFASFVDAAGDVFVFYIPEWAQNVLGAIASYVFVLVIVLLCSHSRGKGLSHRIYCITAMAVTSYAVGVMMRFMDILSSNLTSRWINSSMLLYCVIGILIIGFGWVLGYVLMNNRIYRELDETNRRLLDTQARYYESVQESTTEMKKFRHDLKNHLICVNHLLEEGKTDDSRDYISRMYENLEKYSPKFSTGSDILDAILNEQARVADKQGVSLSVNGAVPKDIQISEFDLSVIFGNALQNAVEGAANVPSDKYVNVSLGCYNNYLNIRIQNSALKNPGLKTTKMDKKNHGFGLVNMYQSAGNLGADIEISQDEESFTVDILIELHNK